MSDQWAEMSAADLGRQIEAGAIDPVELTEFFLSAIHENPFSDRIYARLTPERARAEAKAASGRARAGLRRSPLDGVPISWKDLFDTAGTATEAGSALLQGRVPNLPKKKVKGKDEQQCHEEYIPGIFVMNHMLHGIESPFFINKLYEESGHKVYPRGLADHFHLSIPIHSNIFQTLGAVDGTRRYLDLLMMNQQHHVDPGACATVRISKNFAGKWKF